MMRIINFCMDTKNINNIVECGNMAENRKNNMIVGAKAVKKCLRNRQICTAFLAENADPAVTDPIAQMCSAEDIPLIWVKTMAELGRTCGIEVGAAAAAAIR